MSDLTNLTLILGGGFTGFFTALHLSRQRYSTPVILIDQTERFIFQPLLYELLSGEMSANQVWPRYRDLLQGSGVTFVQDTVAAIDLEQRQVRLASGSGYAYRHLVLALGTTTGYFGVEGAGKYSFAFRTGEDAIALARHLRNCLQQANQTEDPQARQTLLSVAVIGAGPTGVELAATLADLLPGWYVPSGGSAEEIRVILFSRGPEILAGDVNRPIRRAAQQALEQRTVPVECRMAAEVIAVRPQQVEFKHHNQLQVLQAATIVWTAGTATHPLIKALPIPEQHRDSHGRIRVTSSLQLPGFPEVFAGGDGTAIEQNPLPATAQVAYQQGGAIARNLTAISQGKAPSPAQITLLGSMLKLGVGESAVSVFDRFAITGKLGHLIRQGTYLERLPPLGLSLPTVLRWLKQEAFFSLAPQQTTGRPHRKAGAVSVAVRSAIAIAIVSSSSLVLWRVFWPEQFNRVWQPTGLPGLFDQLRPEDSQP